MAKKLSFDIVSRVNLQEVENAINQARKEILNRFDFKGSKSRIEGGDDSYELYSSDESHLETMTDVLRTRFVRRKVPMESVHFGQVEDSARGTVKRSIEVAQGIDSDKGREINKFIKGLNKKVQVTIQKDQVRVASSSKDLLQEIIRELKERDFGIALQFTNYR